MASSPIGVLAALPLELGPWRKESPDRLRQGVPVHEHDRVLAVESGVGKVAAAQAASVLLEEGARALLVVGTCGGLSKGLSPGDLVHCTTAFQADFAVREGREIPADEDLRRAWQEVAPGVEGWFLTADRPVITPWKRLRLRRAFQGPCVADMETAAAAGVARRGGIPFAALRVVSDLAGLGTKQTFEQNYSALGSRPADTVESLLTAPGVFD